MQLILIIAIQISMILLGTLMAASFGVKKRIEIFGLSYLLGSGFMTISFFIFHWLFKLDLDQINFFLSLVLGILMFSLLTFISKRTEIIINLFRFKKSFRTNVDSFSKIEKTIIAIIALLISFTFFENFFWPITDWDALAFYDFRAKVITLNGNMLEGIELKYFFQYPPYTSFLHVFGYLFGADRVKIVYSFLTISFIISFYNSIRVKQSRLISLFLSVLLISTPMIFEHSIMAYSNLPYTVFYSIGLIYLWQYIEKLDKKNLLIGGLLIGLSTWIRSTEPFWILGPFLIIIGLIKYKKNLLLSLLLAIFSIIPNQIWRYFLVQLNNNSQIKIIDVESHSSSAISDFLSQNQGILLLTIRSIEVLKYLVITLSPDFLILTLVLLLTLVNNYKNKKIEIITILLIFVIVFLGTLVFSFTFETWNLIGGSVVRMCMIVIPLILYTIGKDLKYEQNK